MRCNDNMKRFLELEDYLYLPPSIRWHLLFCKGCRSEVKAMQVALEKARRMEPFDMPKDLSRVIMNKIYSSSYVYKKSISSTKWVTVGSLILLSIFLIPFSDSFTWLKLYFKGSLEIPLSIVLGSVITLYAVLFIATHLDGAKEILDYFDKEAH